MKKRLLCVLVAAALLLGILTGCGSGAENGGSSSSPDSGKPGVESAKPDEGGHTADDPAAIMNERVRAVNDALNWECFEVEETVEAGLLFYSLNETNSFLAWDIEPHDYNPDKPLDYGIKYEMVKQHTEGIASEDTYVPLLKAAWDSSLDRWGSFSADDVIATDDLYVWYDSYVSTNAVDDYFYYRGDGTANIGRCFILVKGTDILYRFNTKEILYKADYNEDGIYDSYTGNDDEYIFTTNFWRAFAQTAKFVGNADDDFKDDKYIDSWISTIGYRGGAKIPYIEE